MEKKENKNLEIFKKKYKYKKNDLKWIPEGASILEYIGIEVVFVKFIKDSDANKKWSTNIKKSYIISISDYDPMTSTYLCKYRIVGEDKETSWREMRIIPEGFSFENPEETGTMYRFIPYSLHCKLAETEAFYARVDEIEKKKDTLPVESLKQISESKEQDKVLTYSCNIGAAIRTIDDDILWFRISKLSLRHTYKNNYNLTITDAEGKAITLQINSDLKNYNLKFGGDGIGTLKIIDLED